MPDNEEFVHSLEQATLQIIEEMREKGGSACLWVEGKARQDCPVDMGTLRASVTSMVEMTPEAIVGTIGSNEEYAPYVHNGTGIYAIEGGRKTPWRYKVRTGKYKGWHTTVGQRPTPFLSNAVLFNKDKIEEILGG